MMSTLLNEMNQYFKFLLGIFAFLFMGSCTTEILNPIIEDSEDEPSESTGVPLRIAIDTGDLNNSNFAETPINDLWLFFFEGAGSPTLFKGLVKANPTTDRTLFTCNYPVSSLNLPSYVIALANVSNLPSVSSLRDLLDITVSNPLTYNSVLMSSVRYFSKEDDHPSVFFTELTPKNIETENQEPIKVILERCVAKALVYNNLPSVHVLRGLYYLNGEPVNVSTSIEAWGINGTDTRTYLIKNLGNFNYDYYNGIFGYFYDENPWIQWGSFGTTEYGVVNWALSYNWSETSFLPDSDNEDASVKFLNINEIDGKVSSEKSVFEKYIQETTRPESVFLKENALPQLLVTAVHNIEGTPAGSTFYLKDKELFRPSDYYEYISRVQQAIWYKDRPGVKVAASDLVRIIEDAPLFSDEGVRVWNMVVPSLKKDADLSQFSDIDGNPLNSSAGIEDVNSRLMYSCGAIEKFLNGKSLYKIPVRHFINSDEEQPSPGSYGIVRNNCYLFTLTSIGSLGHGVASDDFFVTDLPGDDPALFNIGIKLSIVPWFLTESNADFSGD